MIALIDYRAGNLTSVRKALAAVGADVLTPEQPGQLRDAAGVIVPGVGHFGSTRTLDASWIDAIRERLNEGVPLLGICLGMQWLYESSDEAPALAGLGVFSGRCARLGGAEAAVKVPHVGWNSLEPQGAGSIVDTSVLRPWRAARMPTAAAVVVLPTPPGPAHTRMCFVWTSWRIISRRAPGRR